MEGREVRRSGEGGGRGEEVEKGVGEGKEGRRGGVDNHRSPSLVPHAADIYIFMYSCTW